MLLTMNILFINEAGQFLEDLLSVLDMMLQIIQNSNIPFVGVLILCSMDHTQLAPVYGKPFSVSSHILSCFKMVRLQHLVCDFWGMEFDQLQVIARKHPSEY